MKYRWPLDKDQRALLSHLAAEESPEVMQAFLKDRPEIKAEQSGDIELSGFEVYVLKTEMSKIDSRAACSGDETALSGTTDHTHADTRKRSDEISALYLTLDSLGLAYPEQGTEFLENLPAE